MPEDPGSGGRDAIDEALDLFVYAPIGAFLHGPETVGDLATRGRQDVANARFLGRAALQRGVGQGREQLEGIVSVAVRHGLDLATAAARAAGVPLVDQPGEGSPDEDGAPSEEPAETHLRVVTDDGGDDAPGVDTLAIPGYDTLAASQVVPRLDDLADDELAAVQDYERAHRGRMTILSRIAQLRAS